MNIAQLLTSSTDNIEDNEFSYSRVHHLLTSKARPPQSVNNSGNNSHSFTSSKFVVSIFLFAALAEESKFEFVQVLKLFKFYSQN